LASDSAQEFGQCSSNHLQIILLQWQPLLAQAGLSVSTTTLAATTTSRPLPPDGPVGAPVGAIVVSAVLGGAALAFLAILETLTYLVVNRLRRRRRAGR
jgi:hypothetical protein